MNTTICERLIGMVKCSSSKDSDFFDLFLSNFSKISINSNNCIANSADGAANMQSAYNRFSTKLSEITKTHLWCYAHVLNIVICDLTNTEWIFRFLRILHPCGRMDIQKYKKKYLCNW